MEGRGASSGGVERSVQRRGWKRSRGSLDQPQISWSHGGGEQGGLFACGRNISNERTCVKGRSKDDGRDRRSDKGCLAVGISIYPTFTWIVSTEDVVHTKCRVVGIAQCGVMRAAGSRLCVYKVCGQSICVFLCLAGVCLLFLISLSPCLALSLSLLCLAPIFKKVACIQTKVGGPCWIGRCWLHCMDRQGSSCA